MMSRIMLMSKGSSTPSRAMVIIISEPTGPRIWSTASFKVFPSVLSPSTLVIKSPDWTPAFAAGVSSMGDTTLI